MESPNRMALDLVDEAIDFADELNVGVSHLENEGVVLDFGVDHPGGVEAGLLLAEVATGGLATVGTRVEAVEGAGLTHVDLAVDHPELALVGCQRPGWDVGAGDSVIRTGGPAQLLREDGGAVGADGDGEFAVLVVEDGRLPGADAVAAVASALGLPTAAVFVLAAPANSVAGSVAFAARAAERAVTGLAGIGHDPSDVVSATASAPVAPLAPSPAEGRARSIAAIAGGGRVHLVLESPVERPGQLDTAGVGAEVVPAQVTLDVVGGDTHVVGGVDEQQLAADLGL